jgi:hypothetical protein
MPRDAPRSIALLAVATDPTQPRSRAVQTEKACYQKAVKRGLLPRHAMAGHSVNATICTKPSDGRGWHAERAVALVLPQIAQADSGQT